MKKSLPPMKRLSQVLLLAGLVTVAAPASAVEYWLRAEAVNVTMPDGIVVPMWGYALTDATFATGTATVPGPALSVPPGDPVLTIHLQNNLPEPTSIVIPGQVAAMTPVWDDGATGARVSAGARVRSFTHETLAGGGTADYTWNNVKPGTYLYHSGTHPQVQVQMGLYGGVTGDVVAATDAAPAQAYAGVPYANEVTLLFSEIDPALHEAVASGSYGTAFGPTSTFDYQPKYFLINGQPHAAGANPLATLVAGERTLLRFLNAGLQTHVPVINGQYLQMIAEDGNPYPWPANPRQQYSVLLPAAKTVDAILTPTLAAGTGPTRYAIYDRRLNLTSGAAQDGGMLAMLEVSGNGTSPAITSSPTLTATQGLAYAYKVTASDPDGGPLTFTLDKAPAGMTVKTTSDSVAWLGWRPTSAQVGAQEVTVRATDPTGLSTTQSFSIAVANGNDAPVANNDNYVMIKGGTMRQRSPGVLANDSDPDVGDTLVVGTWVLPQTGTLARNSDGAIAYTPPADFTGMATFGYRAKDSFGLFSKVATVSVVVRANLAPTTVDDTVSVAPNTSLTIDVLGNDSDPDTVIDPTNRIDPATVFIPLTGKPNNGGTVTVNANGTITYKPRLNFTGTEVFQYAVSDTYSPTAISKAAYVRVNVTNVNAPPVVLNDTYTVIKGGTLNVAAPGVLANDSDPDPGDTLRAANYGMPKAGTLVGNADGSFSYTPSPTFTGMDSFAYLARDNAGLASKTAGWVKIAVRANRGPVTVDDTVATAANTPLVINVLGNDSDPDTAIDPANRIDPATVFIPVTGQPDNGGTVVVNADGTISYTPALDFTGAEVFQYAVRDTYNPAAFSKAASVRVNVQ